MLVALNSLIQNIFAAAFAGPYRSTTRSEPAKKDRPTLTTEWKSVLERRSDRSIASGTEQALCEAIGRGADLRIQTEFYHHEHIEPGSACRDLVRENSEFPCTYLIENRWVAGMMTLRQPVSLPDGFGPRPSMSFFLYNQDGQQAIARPYLDGGIATGPPGPSPISPHSNMPKYHEQTNWDGGTNAPSSSFIYDFEVFRYFVRDDWHEVLSHAADGTIIRGSVEALEEATARGCDLKLGVRGLCSDLSEDPSVAVDHEIFIRAHSSYDYTGGRLLIAASQPLVRARVDIPLVYVSRGWDFGWLIARTDGHTALLTYDPYTLTPRRSEAYHAVRWFAR